MKKQNMLKLGKPIENFDWRLNVSQYYACNRDFYAQNFSSMKFGHNGIDIVIPTNTDNTGRRGYGFKVLATHDFDALRFDTDFPTKTRGNGLWLRKKLNTPEIILGVEAWYMETVYWHLADFSINVQETKSGKMGDVIGLMGNTGFVFPKPSNACPECPYYGTHLHFGLLFYDAQGNEIQTEHAGYNDPTPHLYNGGERMGVYFVRDLMIGSTGDEVAKLQSILKIEGFGDYDTTGTFGPKTMASLIQLQTKYGISPAIGYFGRKTREFINTKYN